MKKIISSAIAIAMLSSTVAMAATVIAPTPQTTTTTYIQTFDGCETNTENNYIDYGSGATNNDMKVSQEASSLVEVIQDPSTGAETGDKVLYQKHTGANGQASTYKINTNNLELGAKDVFTVSFDAALVAADAGASYIRFSIAKNGEVTNNAPKYTNVFRVMPAWVDGLDFTGDGNGTPVVGSPSKTSDKLTHYEIRFDRGKKTVKFITDGTKSETKSFKEGIDLESIQGFSVYFEHKGKAATETTAATEGGFYFDNVSYSVERVPDEKVEQFDAFSVVWNGSGENGWGKSGQLTNVKYAYDGAYWTSTQDLDSAKGKVFKTWGGANKSQLIMPLDYTMTGEDVFTFKFDYANESNVNNSLAFVLDDLSATTLRTMSIHLKSAIGPLDEGAEEFNVGSTLFSINQGRIWIGGKWQTQSYSAALTANQFSTITVVIDNSDEEYANQRTLAVYVDGKLSRTKWIMTDNDETTNSRNITAVSLKALDTTTRYYDNLWATMTSNDIEVADGVASYTYPVVYDDSAAQFIVAKYDSTHRLIGATKTDVAPTAQNNKTVTAPCTPDAPLTKVFLWNTSLRPITGAWSSGE